jgi:plastocyanin
MSTPRLCSLLVIVILAAIGAGYYTSAEAAIAPRYQILNSANGRQVDRYIAVVAEANATPASVVSQKNKTFTPAAVELRVGQTLEIVNDDQSTHNAFCQSGDFKYNAGTQAPGSTSQVTFTKAGTYDVRCAIHPKMLLHVTVTE